MDAAAQLLDDAVVRDGLSDHGVEVWCAVGGMKGQVNDNVDSKNVTFVNCALIYNGGKLKLENVRFVNCTFQVSDAYANNENVLKLLSAALSGQPINLELTAKDDHSFGK